MGRALAQRAAQQRNGGTDNDQTDEEREERERAKTLNGQIIEMQAQFQLAMPHGAEAGQLIRDAMTCVRGTPDLARCSPASVLGGLMTCAQLGLRPGVAGLGHAWLIPMWSKRDRRLDATLIIGYRGYTELAYRHDSVLSIASRVVYTRDHFELGYNLEGDFLDHKPYLDGPRGEPRNYYAIARLKGACALTEPWSQTEMEDHRDEHAMAKTKQGEIVGPWRDHFIEMGRKTMIRNPLVKMIPLSTELAMAVAIDDGVRLDASPDLDPVDATAHPTLSGEVEPDQSTSPDAQAAAEAGVAWSEPRQPGSGLPEDGGA